MSEAKLDAPHPKVAAADRPDEVAKLIREAMKLSELLVKDAIKTGKALIGSNAEDLRIRLR